MLSLCRRAPEFVQFGSCDLALPSKPRPCRSRRESNERRKFSQVGVFPDFFSPYQLVMAFPRAWAARSMATRCIS